MNIKMKAAAMAVTAAMTVSALPFAAFAEDEPIEQIKVLTGTFSGLTVNDRFFYSDEYFALSGKEKNEHLRTMSMALALTSMTTDEPVDAHELFAKIGFEDWKDYDFDTMPTKETVGMVIAHKETEYGDIVAVTVRGSRYEDEVANMLDCGTDGDIKGFSESAFKVLDRIKEYERETDTFGAKLWLTGYSRSAAITDLAGKYINEDLDGFGIDGDALYDYSFEPPAASATAPEYENIHDVKYEYDLVPMVYPAEWGLQTSGVDEIYGEEEEPKTVRKKTFELSTFSFVDKTEYKDGDTVLSDPIPMKQVDENFVKLLTDNISRESFAANGEFIGNIANLFINMDSERRSALTDFGKAALGQISLDSVVPILAPLITAEKGTEDFYAAVDNISAYLIGLFDQQDHSACLSDQEYLYVKTALPSIMRLLAPAIITDVKNPNGMLDTIADFFGNLKALTYDQHYPAYAFEWLKQEDSYYTEKKEIMRGKAVYFADEMSEDVLYDDEALEANGFDETDIEYLKNGYDVVYSAETADNVNYDDLEEGSIKEALDSYILDKGYNIELASIFKIYAIRKRGFEQEEQLPESYGDYITGPVIGNNASALNESTFRILCIDDGGITEPACEFFDDEETGDRYYTFSFTSGKTYAYLFLEDEETVIPGGDPTDSADSDVSVPESSSEEEEESEDSADSSDSEADQSDESSDTDTSSESTASTASEADPSSADASSEAASSTAPASSAAAAPAKTAAAGSNPATGAAAFFGMTALVAAAAVVIRKKH